MREGFAKKTHAITHTITPRKPDYRAITPAISDVITQLERDNRVR